MTEEQSWTFLENLIINAEYNEFDDFCLIFADFCEDNNVFAYKALKYISGKNKRFRCCPRQLYTGWIFGDGVGALPDVFKRELNKECHETLKELIVDLHCALERLSQILC